MVEEPASYDWGEAEEKLSPQRLTKPRVEQASGEGNCSGEVVLRLAAKGGAKEPQIVSRLQVKGKSKDWDIESGELPEVEQGGRTRSQ